MAYNHFVDNTLSALHQSNHIAAFDYEDSPLLTLLCNDSQKKKFNGHLSSLTRNESAIVYLYSMSSSLYSSLNNTLQGDNRDALNSWFSFLIKTIHNCSQKTTINENNH